MQHKKPKRESLDATRASVKREMARPRMAKSARIMKRNLDAGRTPERPSTTLPGTVAKIIPSRSLKQPEKAQIAVEKAARRYRNLRIENSLTDQHGDEVKLKKGAHVEVTVAAKGETSTAKIITSRV
jgi:ribosomal protein L15E